MFTKAIVRAPGLDAASGLTTVDLGRPDVATLVRQHSAYVDALGRLGLEIIALPALAGHPDAYFVEDTALMFPELAIVTRPGAAARLGEADAMAPVIARFRPVVRLTAPATVDGGDVLVVDRTVFVGRSARTNQDGIAQLTAILAPHGYRVVPLRVPEALHLKSSVTWAGGETLVVTEALAAMPELAGYRHVVVPPHEAYAANVLWINGTLLMAHGFPRTQLALEALGLPVWTLDQREVEKMDGALTCMSLRF